MSISGDDTSTESSDESTYFLGDRPLLDPEAHVQDSESIQLNAIQEIISKSLEWVAYYLSLPIHRASEYAIRALATPIRPGEDGNFNSALLERIWRTFTTIICIVTFPATLSLALGGEVLLKIADIVKQKPYIHRQGNAQENVEGDTIRLMTLNACMLWGGLPILLGGATPPRERLDRLAKKIKAEDPDILVMQEVAFDPASSLHETLKDNYAHFFFRIGPNPPLMESGLFVASKFPVIAAGFIPFPEQLGIYRGAFWIETEKGAYITTHMEFGNTPEGKEKRKAQFDLILEKVKAFEDKGKPCFLLGDFNLKRHEGDADYKEMGVSDHFFDPYREKYPNPSPESATCTNQIGAYTLGKEILEERWEIVDYALLSKMTGQNFDLQVDLVHTYDDDKPYEALSDHRGILLTAASKTQNK